MKLSSSARIPITSSPRTSPAGLISSACFIRSGVCRSDRNRAGRACTHWPCHGRYSTFPAGMAPKFTILIAEDNPNDRKLLHLALQRNPREVEIHEVADGTEVADYLTGGGAFHNRVKFPFP